jgi:hypothetical protein
MTVAELQALYSAGEAVVKPDEAEPWVILRVSRASFYRALAAGQVPGALRLGRSYRLRLGALLGFLGALPGSHDGPGGE